MDAYEWIRDEREAQVAKGYTAEHDNEHDGCELAWAAVSYASYAADEDQGMPLWPFDEAPEIPGSQLEALVKAGACIVAEIERVQRTMGI